MKLRADIRDLRHRAWLKGGVAALSLLMAGAVQAQDAPAEEEVEEVVVQGIRRSLAKAIDTKRRADHIVDAISAEDIGRFPDANIAESVQRITGVQIVRRGGEAAQVNIRGLPSNFTLATFNGRSLPDALARAFSTQSRSFDFASLPSEFVQTLEVYKSPTADIDEGGLSGVVNVRTPKALDIGRRTFTVSINNQYESNSGKHAPVVSTFYADTFAEGRIGATLGLSYNRRRAEWHEVTNGYATAPEQIGLTNSGGGGSDLNGDGVIETGQIVRYPGSVFHTIYPEDRKRISAVGSLEFRPNDALRFWVDGFYSELEIDSVKHENLNILSGATGVRESTVEVIDGLETATDFTVLNLDLRNGGRWEDRKGDIWSVVLGSRYEIGAWTLGAEASYGRSKQTRSHLNIADIALGTARFQAVPGDEIPGFIYLDGLNEARHNPESFRAASLNGEFNRRSTDDLWDAKVDVRRDFSDGFFTSVRFGAKYTDRAQYQDNAHLNIPAAALSALYGGLPAGPLPGTYSAAPFMIVVKAGNGTFLDSYDGNAAFPTQWLGSDVKSFASQFSAAELLAAGIFTNDATGITDVEEQTLAFYGRADFEHGRLSGNIGLRAVRTEQQTTGVTPDLNGITVESDAGNITRVPAAQPVTVKRDYWDYLPSLNLKYQATDTIVLRASASRTISRPNLADISPTTSVSGGTFTVTQNNPELDPFRADNYDITAEWYFSRDGLVGGSLFHKKLESLIRRESYTQELPVTYIYVSGQNTTQLRDFTVSRLVNGSGVDLTGIELYYQQAFSFLPAPFDGFGTIVNYTYIDNSDPLQLTAASEHNYNLIAYYEKGRLGARLSYSWRDGFLSSAATLPALSTEVRPYGTLDGSISFKVRDNASILLEAVNILDEDEITRYTNGLPASYIDAGRRIVVGARFNF